MMRLFNVCVVLVLFTIAALLTTGFQPSPEDRYLQALADTGRYYSNEVFGADRARYLDEGLTQCKEYKSTDWVKTYNDIVVTWPEEAELLVATMRLC